MKFLSVIHISILIAIFSAFSSCNKKLEDKVKISLKNNHPIIEIENRNGEDISIIPETEDLGSIGYIVDGKTIWLKGLPEIKESPIPAAGFVQYNIRYQP